MKTCAKCGVEKPRAEFFVRRASKDGLNRLCKPCDKAQSRQWCLEHPEERKVIANRYGKTHPEKVAANGLQWARNNPDKVAATYAKWAKSHPDGAKAWVKNNPEKARDKDRRWKHAHPEVVAANCAKRQSRKIRACPAWADLGAIKLKYKEARLLTAATGVKHHVDHIVPLRSKVVCGLHVDWNLQVIPAIENLKKGNRLMPDRGVGVVPMDDWL